MFLKLLIIFFLRIVILKAKKRALDLSKREKKISLFPFSPFHKREFLWKAMASTMLIMCNGAPRVSKNYLNLNASAKNI